MKDEIRRKNVPVPGGTRALIDEEAKRNKGDNSHVLHSENSSSAIHILRELYVRTWPSAFSLLASLCLARRQRRAYKLSYWCRRNEVWSIPTIYFVNLGFPVQRRLAKEAYIFCCCAFFLSLFFARTHRWESANPAAAVIAPTVEPPHPLLKYRQTSDPRCPPFHRGKMCQILAQISTPVVFKPPYFWTGALYRETKNTDR